MPESENEENNQEGQKIQLKNKIFAILFTAFAMKKNGREIHVVLRRVI